jgi:hypothetical protein
MNVFRRAGALLVPSLSDCLFLALLIWVFALGSGWSSLLADGDTGWHIRTGEYIMDTRSVPSHDLFSFSKPNAAWFAWEWLADVIFAALNRAWGLKGVVVFAAVTLCAAATLLFRHMFWRGANVLAALIATLLATAASTVHYLARPHIFGFSPGVAVGGFIGQNLYRQIGGELRYTFQFSNLKLSGGGSDASFRGQTHTLQYNVLWHARPVRSRMRPFVGVGAGMRVFRGTGKENAYQPLSGFALLTKTQEWKLMAAAGGGIKYRLTPRLSLRAEVWDYATPFPSRVIASSPSASLGGWLHDIVPMVGLTFIY